MKKSSILVPVLTFAAVAAVGVGLWGGAQDQSKDKKNVDEIAAVDANKNAKPKAPNNQTDRTDSQQKSDVQTKDTVEQTSGKKMESEKEEKNDEKKTSEATKIPEQKNDTTPQNPSETEQKTSMATDTEDDAQPVFYLPASGEIVMDYSIDAPVYDATLDQYRTNESVSIAVNDGDDIYASAAGEIVSAGYDPVTGNTVVIDHGNGWQTTYGQLSDELAVTVGDEVASGQMIGKVTEPTIYGSALGCHVDFAISRDGQSIDPKTAVAQN
ncbi:MAG: M23 family metallopeptidase [Clostridiales bacterium]|nr:M23 family metallopeptidase [Clostridiales bacterium]